MFIWYHQGPKDPLVVWSIKYIKSVNAKDNHPIPYKRPTNNIRSFKFTKKFNLSNFIFLFLIGYLGKRLKSFTQITN